MRVRLLILALMAAVSFGTSALMADQPDKGNKQHGNKHSNAGADQGWQQHEGYEYRVYGEGDQRPPGWSKGQKTSWGNCGMPPGQAKKYGCRTYSYQGRPYYYYQDQDGRIVVRRPTIEVHGSVDIVH
jgi:hypothetical protein